MRCIQSVTDVVVLSPGHGQPSEAGQPAVTTNISVTGNVTRSTCLLMALYCTQLYQCENRTRSNHDCIVLLLQAHLQPSPSASALQALVALHSVRG